MINLIKKIINKQPPIRQGVGPEEVRAMAIEAAKRAQQKIGSGQFSQVYAASPGLVTKEIALEKKQKLLNEIDLQAKAAELGFAPKLNSVNLEAPRIGQTVVPLEPGVNPSMRAEITMQDLRTNYVPAGTADITINSALTNQQYLNQAKQMAALALNDISLSDRHPGNVMFHKMTERPIQLDFGIAEPIKSDRQKASNISLAVAQGLHAAGLKEEAQIFQGAVSDFLMTDPKMALDIAKQGLSRLQKIKVPIDPQKYVYATVNSPEDFISILGN
jgi:hypothetical protein